MANAWEALVTRQDAAWYLRLWAGLFLFLMIVCRVD